MPAAAAWASRFPCDAQKLRLDNPTVNLFMGDSSAWRRLVHWVLGDSALARFGKTGKM